MRIVVDSYAWIEFFLGSPKGNKVKETIETATNVYTPDAVLAELSRKYLREGVSEKLTRERLRTVHEASLIVHITPDIAIHAAKAYFELVEKAKHERLGLPSLFDGIILGTTRAKEAKVLTGDAHFRNLPETIWA